MSLDVQTLLVCLMLSVLAIATALPAVIGWRASPGARHVQAAAVGQALGWVAFLVAPGIHDQWVSTLSIGLIGASFVAMWLAARCWLGPRPGASVLIAASVLTPLGYGFGFGDYAFRVGWSNFGLAVQIGCVCVALLWPAPGTSLRWRALVAASLGALALVTIGRGVLGAFYTELYPYYRAPHPLNIAAALTNHVALVLTMLGFLVAWHEEAERDLRRLADTDALTGLFNRRAFELRCEDALAQARRHGDSGCLVLLDIDHFKGLNDHHGHAAGDAALRAFGRVLQASLRRGDLACRWGGEEFCVLLTRADPAAAQSFDERLRQALAQAAPAPLREELTYSAGIAGFEGGSITLESLIRRADEALYRAKAEGRDRSLLEASLSEPPLDSTLPR